MGLGKTRASVCGVGGLCEVGPMNAPRYPPAVERLGGEFKAGLGLVQSLPSWTAGRLKPVGSLGKGSQKGRQLEGEVKSNGPVQM